MGSGKLIFRAIKKYGVENFKKEILFVFDNEEEMNLKEKELVVLSENSYNLCPGGQGGFGYINANKLNLYGKNAENLAKAPRVNFKEVLIKRGTWDDYKKKLSERMKGRPGTWIGRKHTEESKDKIRGHKWQCGVRNSQYGTCWITNGSENKKIKKEDFEKWSSQGYYKGRI